MIPEETILAGGPGNTLYIVERISGKFARYDRFGKKLEIVNPDAKGVAYIQDCGVADDGSVFILYDHEKEINDYNYSHVGKITSTGDFIVLAGPFGAANNFPLAIDAEHMAVAPDGELHLIDYDFDNFRILGPDGSTRWRSSGTIREDKERIEEFEENIKDSKIVYRTIRNELSDD